MSVVSASVGLSLYPIFDFLLSLLHLLSKCEIFVLEEMVGIKGVYLRQMGEVSRRLVLT